MVSSSMRATATWYVTNRFLTPEPAIAEQRRRRLPCTDRIMPSRAPAVAAKAGASPSPIPVATAIATAKSQTIGPKLTFIS